MDDKKTLAYNLILHGVVKFKSIKKDLQIASNELDIILEDLINDNKIIYDKKYDEYYALKEAKLDIKPSGFAFALNELEDDYYISQNNLNGAYNGDIALVYPFKKGPRLIEAKVYKIIKRAYDYVIGELKVKELKSHKKYYIKSNIIGFDVEVIVDYANLAGSNEHDIVYATLKYKNNAIYGYVKEILGNKSTPGIDISMIALEYGFQTEFDLETIKYLENIPTVVSKDEIKDRSDFRADLAITIDGDDSKDFDDAVYLEKKNDNYLLKVYIADVANYVKENTPLDKEAYKRGTSVYLADRVIPMLPIKLSNGICSLNEGVDRLVLACIMEIDPKGNLVNYEITEGVINSRHRMTYNNVNKILNGDLELQEKYSDIKDMLFLMKELSDIIRARRYKKGGLEFETNEYKFVLNEDSSPKEISLRERLDAEKIIEDFMLEANETVAYNMSIMNLPCAYRIHEKPDQEKLHNVFSIIKNMGVNLKNTKNDIHPKQIQDALEKINDISYSPILNNMLLRSMMKAKYYEKCLGHYGLAMNYYCHFTSPIRRYPDLLVHRIIKRLIINPNNYSDDLIHFEQILPDACINSSVQERKSIDCERATNDMLYAWYMSKYTNCEFDGIITSMTSFGMFVTLDNGAEGLVSFNEMNEYFAYDPDKMMAIGQTRSYKLGDKVKIVVTKADKRLRKVSFMLKEDYEEVFLNEDNLSK